MRIYSNVYDYATYIYLNYEDISLFEHFKYAVKIYAHNFIHLLKISINNRTFLYIHKNTHKYT